MVERSETTQYDSISPIFGWTISKATSKFSEFWVYVNCKLYIVHKKVLCLPQRSPLTLVGRSYVFSIDWLIGEFYFRFITFAMLMENKTHFIVLMEPCSTSTWEPAITPGQSIARAAKGMPAHRPSIMSLTMLPIMLPTTPPTTLPIMNLIMSLNTTTQNPTKNLIMEALNSQKDLAVDSKLCHHQI